MLQKLLCNSFIREHEECDTLHWVKSAWGAFVVRGLGMIPLVEDCEQELSQSNGAFELLRVRLCLVRTKSFLNTILFMPTAQVRNRFAEVKPRGGYRDINVKIRVGFKGDAKDSRPLFCPV